MGSTIRRDVDDDVGHDVVVIARDDGGIEVHADLIGTFASGDKHFVQSHCREHLGEGVAEDARLHGQQDPATIGHVDQ